MPSSPESTAQIRTLSALHCTVCGEPLIRDAWGRWYCYPCWKAQFERPGP